MPAAFDARYLSATTPFGDEVTLERVIGEERLSQPFEFRLDLRSPNRSLDFKSIVGKDATVKLVTAGGTERFLNGVVTRFQQGPSDQRSALYHAEVRPRLWLLGLGSDCRIFQTLTVPEILQKVFEEHGVTQVKNSLKASYQPREYCVQYRETHLDFVTRLMEEEGIWYCFEHGNGKHTLVLGDDPATHAPCPGDARASYRPDLAGAWEAESVVVACSLEQQVCTGMVTLQDYNFETPETSLLAKVEGKGIDERYDYPGKYAKKDAGDAIGKLRIEALEWPEKQLTGSSYCRGFSAGCTFELEGHDRDDVNAKYLLAWVSHAASAEDYRNAFAALPADVPFRPPRRTPKPIIPGTQTAVVVGKSGEEIWTDKYGRIVVQFHWDREGQSDEKSSCWVRVAQGWAGKAWGNFFLPRIGQEVVVSFLEGDPDRPLVTGSVYNAAQTVPYALPDEQTKSTLKSNSSKGGGGFNEVRFEDKKDAEEVFVHAQKDMNVVVEHDLTRKVLNDAVITIKKNRTTTIEEEHEKLTVAKGNRTVEVTKGNQAHTVGGTRDITVTKAETHESRDDFTHKVTKNYVLKVQGDLTIEVTGKIAIKSGMDMSLKAGMNLDVKAGMNLKQDAGIGLSSKAGAELKSEAPMISSKAAGMHAVEGGGMLTLKGGIVKIN